MMHSLTQVFKHEATDILFNGKVTQIFGGGGFGEELLGLHSHDFTAQRELVLRGQRAFKRSKENTSGRERGSR